MQNLNFGPLDESKFQQPALKLSRGQTVCAFADANCMNTPAESPIRLT
jgi:hypothetical protein